MVVVVVVVLVVIVVVDVVLVVVGLAVVVVVVVELWLQIVTLQLSRVVCSPFGQPCSGVGVGCRTCLGRRLQARPRAVQPVARCRQ